MFTWCLLEVNALWQSNATTVGAISQFYRMMARTEQYRIPTSILRMITIGALGREGLSVGRPRYRAGSCGRRGSSTKAMILRFVVDDLSDAGVEQLPSLADSFEIALHNNRFPSLVGLNGPSVVGVL